MGRIRLSIMLLALPFFVGCDEVPTENDSGAVAPMAAKGGNKPKPPGEDPPAAWTAAQQVVYRKSVTKKGKLDRQIVVASIVANPDGSVGSADEAIILTGPTEVFGPAWSASGDAILFEVSNGFQGRGIYAVRRDPATNSAGAPEFLFPTVAGGLPAMSPDGSMIAYVDFGVAPGDIWVRRRAPDGSWGNPLNIDSNGPDVTGFAPAWAPDSRRLAATNDMDVVVYDIDPDGNGAIDLITTTNVTAGGPLAGLVGDGQSSFARTDDRLVFGNAPGLWIVDFNDPGHINTCLLLAANGSVPSWSPDDTRIVYQDNDSGDIRVVSLDPAGSQANGCPAVLSDDIVAPRSSRCSGRSCEVPADPNWRRF
jgi:hypothetical protein